jgi:hypothetical protein
VEAGFTRYALAPENSKVYLIKAFGIHPVMDHEATSKKRLKKGPLPRDRNLTPYPSIFPYSPSRVVSKVWRSKQDLPLFIPTMARFFIIILFQCNGSDGADLHTGRTIIAGKLGESFLPIKADNGFYTPFGKIQKGLSMLSPADLDTFTAKDTAIGVVMKKRVFFLRIWTFQIGFKALLL